MLILPLVGGCTILGFLLSPSAYDKGIKPVFPLKDSNQEKMYVVVYGTRASGVDADVPGKTSQAIAKELIRKVNFRKELVEYEPNEQNPLVQDYFSWTQLEQKAREKQICYVLYVEIVEYELFNMHKNDFTGSLTTRSILLDVKTGTIVWPREESGRIHQVGVDLNVEGREELLWRLTSAAAHCIVREFYFCPETEYSIRDEIKSVNTLMEDLD